MKKLIALVLVCLLCLGTAYAAEWREGLGPNKPYSHSPEADFSKNLGYLVAWPNSSKKIIADTMYCDVLEMYMPREDIALGEGKITLCDANGVIAEMDCADPAQMELRPLEEAELESLIWGSGTCLEIHLPISLEFDKDDYYVMMDEGVLCDPSNGIKNPPMGETSNWHPLLQDDYGVGGLYYAKAADPEAENAGAVEYSTYDPQPGDTITFNLKLGGEAKEAVIYTENDSVYFQPFQFTESCVVTGTVVSEDVNWGIIFLDENGDNIFLDGEKTQPATLVMRQGNYESAAGAAEEAEQPAE